MGDTKVPNVSLMNCVAIKSLFVVNSISPIHAGANRGRIALPKHKYRELQHFLTAFRRSCHYPIAPLHLASNIPDIQPQQDDPFQHRFDTWIT